MPRIKSFELPAISMTTTLEDRQTIEAVLWITFCRYGLRNL
jgi:hypothetical protein